MSLLFVESVAGCPTAVNAVCFTGGVQACPRSGAPRSGAAGGRAAAAVGIRAAGAALGLHGPEAGYPEAAHRKPVLPVELSGVLWVRAATR